ARLGVAEDASAEDIRRAYRQKSKTAHPDKGGTEEVFKKLGEAYTALSAPARRRDYD
ncbi:DnaJ domain-containing protein, partial [Pelagophyceae sp. CCMP2097]